MTEKRKNIDKVSNLRFPEFTNEWGTRNLGEMIEIQSGFAFKSEYFSEEGIKLVIPKNFTKYGYGNFDSNISKFSRENPPTNYKCKENDLLILLTDLTPSCELLGKPLMIKKEDGEVWLNQRIIRLDVNEEILKNWLLYFLQTEKYHKVIKETATGSTVRHSSNKIINNIILQVPTIEEQNKISSFLSIIDERITSSMKTIESLESLMSSVRSKLLLNKHSDSNWKKKKIKEILTIGNGKDYKHLNFGNIPVMGTGGIITYVDFPIYNGETVCIGRKGTINKPIYYNGKIWTVDTLFYTHSFIDCLPKFIFYIFQTINWLEHNEASGVPSLSKSTIEKIQIQLPSIGEQYKIVKILDLIETKIETEKKILELLEQQKKYFLQNLFI